MNSSGNGFNHSNSSRWHHAWHFRPFFTTGTKRLSKKTNSLLEEHQAGISLILETGSDS